MGVKISTASLAAAVSNCQAAGTIASVGLAYGIDETGIDVVKVSNQALREEIRKAKDLSQGIIGVNIMVALSNFEELVLTALDEGIDFIISGAGLPLKLPELAKGYKTKLIPIVSSRRSADIIIKTWLKRYNRQPDALVIEGPLAGGHLGFKFNELQSNSTQSLESLMLDILDLVNNYKKNANIDIPLIAAGGIFEGKDIARMIKLGANGVQMATRFVTTHECSVPDEVKDLYLKASIEDIVIIDSPVGMPARAIKTPFVEALLKGRSEEIICRYKCLKTCDPKTAPYCIARALCNAVIPKIKESIIFCGSNVWRVNEKTSVKELIDKLVQEAQSNL